MAACAVDSNGTLENLDGAADGYNRSYAVFWNRLHIVSETGTYMVIDLHMFVEHFTDDIEFIVLPVVNTAIPGKIEI